MVRHERNSLLVIRAWIENDAEAGGFRARLTCVPDASTPEPVETVAASRAEVVAIVEEWLDGLIPDR
ncbi:MAG TPA: hypothetical protein VF872_07270 [Gaiellaceae bacterium]